MQTTSTLECGEWNAGKDQGRSTFTVRRRVSFWLMMYVEEPSEGFRTGFCCDATRRGARPQQCARSIAVHSWA